MSAISPEMELVMALSSLHSHLLKKIDQSLSAHGISFTEFMVMHQLNGAPNKTMRRIDLAESIGLSASGVTRLLAPMEKIKLVQKQANPRDARVSLVKLSTTGEQVFADALVSFRENATSLLQGLGSKKLATLLELIKTLL